MKELGKEAKIKLSPKIKLFGKKVALRGKKITMVPKISLLAQKKEDADDRLPEHG